MKIWIALLFTTLAVNAHAENSTQRYTCITDRGETVEMDDELDVDQFSPISDAGEQLVCNRNQDDDLLQLAAYPHGRKSLPHRHRVVHRNCLPSGATCRGWECDHDCCHPSGGHVSIFYYSCQ